MLIVRAYTSGLSIQAGHGPSKDSRGLVMDSSGRV